MFIVDSVFSSFFPGGRGNPEMSWGKHVRADKMSENISFSEGLFEILNYLLN